MTWTATVTTLGFILISMFVSLWLRLKLERDLIIGTIRATIQLISIGYVLHFIFTSNHWYWIGLVLLVMITVASQNAAARGKGIPWIFCRIFLTIFIVAGFTLLMMLFLHLIQAKPQVLIPISGMIVGNSMVVSSLVLNQMRQQAEQMREDILVALSLGATSRQASMRLTREAIRSGTIPIVDSLKTVGLVQLPGMMTGLIIAGTNPIEAVRYQLLIMFSFTASATLTSILMGLFVYPTLFNRAHQFIGWRGKTDK
ncbi:MULTISPECIES: iron export ABC transporter permease subunit FetB [Thermoactinomyces]|jgi:putative ABC transport system permease protein|uniref:Iron export ABC transporter permease subunit FetB n=1 Tax=Thermoactinomyces daqus TaxID=1329516 RepID=A0A7W1X8X5_9BACL|nr:MULTISPECIES: iron export ABC transporter permease subunit FetB [Thermoactinomyces]MBA4542228.1 iron export ABC transporter permease subunit FetB [Thermoactinomyces daqus]MBH8598321.1 iron export ABC transporter permease subunit FetB [Thermoactinomyces sp. CICC 10523]MBH8604444.1 iron export ABC transporter permease subunit FetB [Thermoactinomyces sp. CICC 10522]